MRLRRPDHPPAARLPAAGLPRRAVLAGLGTLPLGAALSGAGPAAAEVPVGAVEGMEGAAFARAAAVRRLSARAAILLGDLVWTEARSRLTLGLDGGSRIHLGPEAQLVVDRFIAASGGELRFGAGALVFDRDDALDKIDLEIRTVYGQIGVRGTRFFAGPSNGVFAVFVERGAVAVAAGGTIRRLEAGEGADLTDRATPPGPVARWSSERVEAAFRSVFG